MDDLRSNVAKRGYSIMESNSVSDKRYKNISTDKYTQTSVVMLYIQINHATFLLRLIRIQLRTVHDIKEKIVFGIFKKEITLVSL